MGHACKMTEAYLPLVERALQQAKTPRFPGLDGVRALAALGVIICHTEQARFLYGFPNRWDSPSFSRLGSLCVSLFFVLSGFLITALLLRERGLNGTISITQFYARRILRIWPLYFSVVALGFLIIPSLPMYDIPNQLKEDGFFWQKLFLYVLFSPHLASAIFPPEHYAGVLWSVGVEEWFYIGWPLLVVAVKKRAPLVCILIFIIVFLLIAHSFSAALIINASYSPLATETILKPLFVFLGELRFGCMAFGALGAVGMPLFTSNSRLVAALFSKQMQFVVFSYLVYCLYTGKNFVFLDEQVYSVLFLYVIINFAYNRGAVVSLDSRIPRWLGRISYGMYCFNWFAIISAVLIVRAAFPHADAPLAQFCLQGLAIGLTIMAAQLSYTWLERPFLRLKHYVSPIEVVDP